MPWITEVPLAHRGLHGAGAPENSLTAFRRAVEAGVGIELDVHRCADGDAVVVHDADLERVTGRPGLVAELTARELAGYELSGGDGEGVPTLGDVLDLVGGRVPVMVELKSFDRRVGPLERAVLDRISGYRGGVAVASFNPATVDWYRVHATGVARGQTAGSLRGSSMPAWLRPMLASMLLNHRTQPHFLSYELSGLPNRWASAWRARGRPLVAWTVRNRADLAHARATADNVIFEGLAPTDVRG
ncbi:MAG TPA: glycerophosphodiester phosphodiesterase family protein [Nitriliruptorales bacterium]